MLYGAILLTLAGTAQGVASALQTFKAPGGFRVQAPESWLNIGNDFGFPIMAIGPDHGKGRPVVMVVPIGTQVKSFDQKAFRDTQEDYREGRRDWLRRRGGELVAFDDYQVEQWSPDTEAHVFGVRYRLGDAEFAERSRYVACNGTFVIVKSVLPVGAEKVTANDIDVTARSLKCTQ